MDRTGRAVLVLFSGRREKERAFLRIFASLTPISMFSLYAENVLRQELFVCEKTYEEFIG